MKPHQAPITFSCLTGLVFLAAAELALARDAAREARELRETGRPAEAEELLRSRLEQEPEAAELLVELGEAMLDTGRHTEAFAVFRRVVLGHEARRRSAVDATAGELASAAAGTSRPRSPAIRSTCGPRTPSISSTRWPATRSSTADGSCW